MADTQTSTVDTTYDERIKDLERANKGLIRDLQEERQKKHQYEERLQTLETSLASAGEEEKPEERVNQLAANPDEFISQRFQELAKPLIDEVQSLKWDRKFDQAYGWLAKQEKIDSDEIRGSDLEKDIARIVKEHGMGSMDPYEGTKAAYKIYRQEQTEHASREEARSEAISGQKTETVRSTSPGQTMFTVEQIGGMPYDEYMKNREAILEAQSKGLIK